MRAAAIPPERRRGAFAWRRYGLLLVGGPLVLCVLAAALFPEWIAPYSPYELNVASMLQGPSAAHWLGTDELGRDVLSRAIHAARISVEVAVVAVGVGLLGGTLIGIVAAYFGGLDRHAADAPDGASVLVPGDPARGDPDGEPRHQHPQRDDRDRDHLHPGLCPPRAGRDPWRAAPAVHRRRAHGRHVGPADPPARDPAQRGDALAGRGGGRLRLRRAAGIRR